jgi:hypothetical protein
VRLFHTPAYVGLARRLPRCYLSRQTTEANHDRQKPSPRRRTAEGQSAPHPTRITPPWRVGDRVRWQDKAGLFRHDLGDGNAEVAIADRAYRFGSLISDRVDLTEPPALRGEHRNIRTGVHLHLT